QRYEVLLGRESQGGASAEGQQPDLLGEGHYATVVRTAFVMGEDGQTDRLGIGLRFDQPLVL
ncbi:MAG: hypothetical protein ACYSVY_20185, partial [Planctomycetota bacterium]